ncbi:uncharacterized protein [Aristolochia californica]|uniref:uncharacterized protein n=1 Tax=Aristolochia californica TaxID=171875 RepID=UPI0035D6BC5A
MAPTGTVIYSAVGRTCYGFDIFSVNIPPKFDGEQVKFTERRLTDGVSVNFNGQFLDEDGSLVFVSERSGRGLVYVNRPENPEPEQLPSIPGSLFHDRPVLTNGQLYLVSNHEPGEKVPSCWTAVYSATLTEEKKAFRRLTPFGTSDFSPAVSRSGKYIAVASYVTKKWQPWDPKDHKENPTDVVVFRESDPATRTVICDNGGWPSWLGDSTIFFHRKAEDGWFSVFRVELPENLPVDGEFLQAERITPPGVHAFTPSVSHDGKKVALVTRRHGSYYRHVELFDLETKSFQQVTELINPTSNHYNPFFSPDSGILGYHRFRGDCESGELTMPHLEEIDSPVKDLRMIRINGDCPSLSPDGRYVATNPDFDMGFDRAMGIRVIRTDGTKRWSVLNNQIAFSVAWSPTEKGVLYTSVGMIFQGSDYKVNIARVKFNEPDLTDDRDEVPSEVKILTKESTGNNAFPSVSPDGKYVVFRSGRTGNKNLYIMDAVEGEHNGGIRQLTDGEWIDTMPTWSPDGKYIAFSSNRHNPSEQFYSIYLIHPDGTGLRRVETQWPLGSVDRTIEKANHVTFANDSQWVVFAGNYGGISAENLSMPYQFQAYGDIYTCKIDGTGLQRLTWQMYENGPSTWHPHGEKEMGSLSKKPADGDKLEGQFEEIKWLNVGLPNRY